jgi:hypothetical protein
MSGNGKYQLPANGSILQADKGRVELGPGHLGLDLGIEPAKSDKIRKVSQVAAGRIVRNPWNTVKAWIRRDPPR